VGSVDPDKALGHAFRSADEAIVLVGYGTPRLDGSEYLGAVGCPPVPDPPSEVALGELLVAANEAGLITSAHDVGTGGLAVAIVECSMPAGVGATITAPDARRADEALFGEGAGRVIVSCATHDLERLCALAAEDLDVTAIGETGGHNVTIASGTASVQASVAELAATYDAAIPGALNEH